MGEKRQSAFVDKNDETDAVTDACCGMAGVEYESLYTGDSMDLGFEEMKLARMFLAAFVSFMMTAQAPALAQVTVLVGKYTDGNIIRVVSRVKMPAPAASAYKVAMLKAATMAGQKGFSRLAVIKVDDCGYLGIGNNSLPIVQTCKIFAQMVVEGEIAEPKGKYPIKYYSLKKMNDGIYVPTPEKESSE